MISDFSCYYSGLKGEELKLFLAHLTLKWGMVKVECSDRKDMADTVCFLNGFADSLVYLFLKYPLRGNFLVINEFQF